MRLFPIPIGHCGVIVPAQARALACGSSALARLPSRAPASLRSAVLAAILAAILMLAGFQMVLTGIVADLISSSRGILEEVSYRLRRVESPEKKDRTDDA